MAACSWISWCQEIVSEWDILLICCSQWDACAEWTASCVKPEGVSESSLLGDDLWAPPSLSSSVGVKQQQPELSAIFLPASSCSCNPGPSSDPDPDPQPGHCLYGLGFARDPVMAIDCGRQTDIRAQVHLLCVCMCACVCVSTETSIVCVRWFESQLRVKWS